MVFFCRYPCSRHASEIFRLRSIGEARVLTYKLVNEGLKKLAEAEAEQLET